MGNQKVKSKGSRVVYATAGTTMAAQAPNASIPSPWVQVHNIQDADHQKNELTKYDDGDLEDAVEVPALEVKPGKLTFTKSKSTDPASTSESVTLQGFCDGSTDKAWAIIYADGTVAQTAHGFLTSSSGGKAANGDLKAKPSESYEVIAKGDVALTEHATPP